MTTQFEPHKFASGGGRYLQASSSTTMTPQMAHASTNTPPDEARVWPQRDSAQGLSGTSTSGQPKRRGPKVGSRRSAPGGRGGRGGGAANFERRHWSGSGATANEQQQQLASGGGQTMGPLSSSAPDPYAFHCEPSAAAAAASGNCLAQGQSRQTQPSVNQLIGQNNYHHQLNQNIKNKQHTSESEGGSLLAGQRDGQPHLNLGGGGELRNLEQQRRGIRMLAHPHKPAAGAQVQHQQQQQQASVARTAAAGEQLGLAYYATTSEPYQAEPQQLEPQQQQFQQAPSQAMMPGPNGARYGPPPPPPQAQASGGLPPPGAYQMGPAYAGGGGGEQTGRPPLQAQRPPAYLQHAQQTQIPVRHPQAGQQQQQLIEQQQQQHRASYARQQQPIVSGGAGGQLQGGHTHNPNHHFNSSVNIQQQQQQANSSNQVQQPQQISAVGQHQMMNSGGGQKDLIRGEQQQYAATQSPTLLQQQLNRHRTPMGGHQVHAAQVTGRTGPPLARAPTHNQQPPQLEVGMHAHSHAQHSYHMEPSLNGHHHTNHHHQNHMHHQQQQQPAAATSTGVYQQQRPMHKQRALPAGAPLRQPQQQVIAGQQLDMSHHHHLQQAQFSCNPTPPLTPNGAAVVGPRGQLAAAAAAAAATAAPGQVDDWQQAYSEHSPHQPPQVKPRIMPKSSQQQQHFQPQQQLPGTIQYHPNAAPMQQQHGAHFIPQQQQPQANVQLIEQQQQHVIATTKPPSSLMDQLQVRLTLPLRDAILVGPFKLEHGLQFTSRTFHLRPQLFDTLSKSMQQQQQQTSAVVQELQFRAYLTHTNATSNDSSLCPASGRGGDSLLLANQRQTVSNACQWPDLFQVSCNQQLVHLDRRPLTPTSGVKSSGQQQLALAHKAADIFPYCQPGDNLLELQVNDCYCSHEFVLELVDRPTLKAFMNSCFKSRLLSSDSCLLKLRSLFGAPNSLCQLPAANIFNEYLTEYLTQQSGSQNSSLLSEQQITRVKLSLRCPLTGRRMRTPTRGPNCKHLQCFDLESFLYANRERTRWSCPICLQHVPFNMLELDQLQMNICQTMAAPPSSPTMSDDVLIDPMGQWQAFQPAPPPQQVYPNQQQQTAKANGTYHPQAPPPPARLASQSPAIASPATSHWEASSPPTTSGQGVRRPPSASLVAGGGGGGGRRSAGPPQAKRPYVQATTSGSQLDNPATTTTAAAVGGPQLEAGLSPLAAMERTIIHHEQQMGPPPFDANLLTSSSPLRVANGGNSNSTSATSLNASHQSPGGSAPNSFASPHHHQPSPAAATSQACSSPARQMAASPQTPAAGRLPQSPAQQHQPAPLTTQISTPATPLIHNAPETPATPGSSAGCAGSQQQQPIAQHAGVDHQPLSNGSASAASIGSSSTLTPSNQSLGSVGMGGDSRCNTAPLQNSLGSLDDLVVLPSGVTNNQAAYQNKQQQLNNNNLNQQQSQQAMLEQTTASCSSLDYQGDILGGQQLGMGVSAQADSNNLTFNASVLEQDKSEILMSKLMMDGDRESRQSSDLALALEEAEWKQQLDQGKSEHLANFLNEPLMNKKHHHHHHYYNSSSINELDGSSNNQMLSGGLNPSDDEGANMHSPLDNHLNQLTNSSSHCGLGGDQNNHLLHHHHNSNNNQHHQQLLEFPGGQQQAYASYLDAHTSGVGIGTTDDDDAGLPPDDSILDLFER